MKSERMLERGERSDARIPRALAERGVRVERTFLYYGYARNGNSATTTPVFRWRAYVDGECVGASQKRLRDAVQRAEEYLAKRAP